ncbi:uncharacterized protein LOC117575528 [Drosophila albomicans]|uniref:Uncharacterized protein LOC117575528 n=1 Tax=Drosophila albomicans TaxID=7291 RepID=A0A6P8ZE26_DROAB|nr:uncharacterized protein LOC117575528 [Drosophila albomicans]
MVNGNTGTLTMRLVRSKLRKRDERRSASPTNAASAATAAAGAGAVAVSVSAVEDHHENEDDRPRATVTFSNTETTVTTNNCSPTMKDHQHVTFVRTSGVSAQQTVGHAEVTAAIAEWTFPPKAPVPHIYHINPELLVANDKISFKGFRKQFSGRFKRLVARKPEPAPVIPPELKPQLKTIYVY